MSTRNLSNVVLFNLSVSLWTGQKKLQKQDIDNDLPKDLGSLGHKKTVDPKALCPMATVKKAMETALSNIGIRFMGNFYAIPVDRLTETKNLLEEKVFEGNKIRQDFLDRYHEEVESWIKQHPDWEDRLRPAIVPVDRVASAIQFGYDVFTINAVEGFSQGIEDQASQMGTTLFGEVSDDVNELYDRSVLGKDSVNRRILKPFERIRSKLFGFSFVDPIVLPLIKLIDSTMKSMPDDGPITGKELSLLSACMMALSDENKMREYAKRLITGQTSDDDVEDVSPILITLPIQAPIQASLLDQEVVLASSPAPAASAPVVVSSALVAQTPVASAPIVQAPIAVTTPFVSPVVAPVRRKMRVAA